MPVHIQQRSDGPILGVRGARDSDRPFRLLDGSRHLTCLLRTQTPVRQHISRASIGLEPLGLQQRKRPFERSLRIVVAAALMYADASTESGTYSPERIGCLFN